MIDQGLILLIRLETLKDSLFEKVICQANVEHKGFESLLNCDEKGDCKCSKRAHELKAVVRYHAE